MRDPLTPVRRFGLCALVVVLGLLLTACGGTPSTTPATPASTAPAPAFQRYVALGDSSAAGPVLRPQQPDQPRGCSRSAVNFPTLVAQQLRVPTFVDVTCSGATTTSILDGGRGERSQVQAVTPDTDLVTIGPLGANDASLVPAAFSCFNPGCAQRFGTSLEDKVAATRPGIRAVIARVQQRAPKATIVVVGYGRYLPAAACPKVQPITAADGRFLQGVLDDLDGVLRQEAKRAKIRFLDLRAIPGAAAHTACAPAGTRWLEGLLVGSKDGAVPYHPTSLGMRAFAEALVRVLLRRT